MWISQCFSRWSVTARVNLLSRNTAWSLWMSVTTFSAAGFEQVLRAVCARYVYGLTATPTRADGHEPIITMQCGPIRYQVSAAEQAARQGFARIVVPRFTRFAMPLTTEKNDLCHNLRSLIRDTLRNKLIVQDTADLLGPGAHATGVDRTVGTRQNLGSSTTPTLFARVSALRSGNCQRKACVTN